MSVYVDDIQEVETVEDLPKKGELSVIYIIKNTKQMFRWDGGKYVTVHIAQSPENPVPDASLEALRLRREIADLKKSDSESKAALGIIAAANRRVGYAAMILFVMWLNGWRYVSDGWDIFFSLFGYTVYLSMVRVVDYAARFADALLLLLQQSGHT